MSFVMPRCPKCLGSLYSQKDGSLICFRCGEVVEQQDVLVVSK